MGRILSRRMKGPPLGRQAPSEQRNRVKDGGIGAGVN